MRTLAIWIFGILAAGIAGSLIGAHLSPYNEGGFWGALSGAFAFTCGRLWLGSKPA